MESHEDVVLEERVGTRPVVARPGVEPVERMGWSGQEQEKEGTDGEQDQEGPPHHWVVQAVAKPPSYQDYVTH